MTVTSTPTLAPSWCWLVGIPDPEYGFLAVDHDLAKVGKQWHSLRPDGPTSVCGVAIPVDAVQARQVYTVCDFCGMALARVSRAVHVPWSVAIDVTFAAHRGGPTSALEGAGR